MPRLQNGMIAFLRDQVLPGPKMLDVEVTNTFPLIALTRKTSLICSNQEPHVLERYDHISIPPDFRLHISGPEDRIFFDANPVWNFLDTEAALPFHYFTIVGLPAYSALPLVEPGQTRTWHQAEIIAPFKDSLFNDATRLFIDFFLHHLPVNPEIILKAPFAKTGMRLAADNSGATLGPYDFSDIQRRKHAEKDISFTIRFGFVNMEDNAEMYVYTPLNIFQRRSR